VERLDQLARQLLGARSILLTTHKAPDGDGIGCLLALRRILIRAGRTVTALTIGEVPGRYRFLPDANRAADWELLSERGQRELLDAHELIFVVDTNSWAMLGSLGEILQHDTKPAVFLDHHPNPGAPRENLFGDPTASSAGEVCWHVIPYLGVPIDADTATCLYTAIAYDTNSFKYIRRRAETLRIAAALVDLGADTDEVYRNIFASNPLAKVLVMGELAQRIHLEEGGMVAWGLLDAEMIQRTRARSDDLRDAITHLLEIEGVEIAITFKERAENRYKVSLRSKGRFPVGGISQRLGGGGHLYAAGAYVDGPRDEIIERVLRMASAVIAETATRTREGNGA
jgi:bifunctional oligoribonuclease and PAP phosphatase NrnA